MTRRFWIALLVSALVLGAIVALSITSATGDDDRPDAEVDEVVGPTSGGPALTP